MKKFIQHVHTQQKNTRTQLKAQTNPYFLSDIFNIETSNSYQIKIQIGKRFCRNIINSKTCRNLMQ